MVTNSTHAVSAVVTCLSDYIYICVYAVYKLGVYMLYTCYKIKLARINICFLAIYNV